MVSLLQEEIQQARNLHWGRRWYPWPTEALTIFTRDGSRYDFWNIDSHEWADAIQNQCALARLQLSG